MFRRSSSHLALPHGPLCFWVGEAGHAPRWCVAFSLNTLPGFCDAVGRHFSSKAGL